MKNEDGSFMMLSRPLPYVRFGCLLGMFIAAIELAVILYDNRSNGDGPVVVRSGGEVITAVLFLGGGAVAGMLYGALISIVAIARRVEIQRAWVVFIVCPTAALVFGMQYLNNLAYLPMVADVVLFLFALIVARATGRPLSDGHTDGSRVGNGRGWNGDA